MIVYDRVREITPEYILRRLLKEDEKAHEYLGDYYKSLKKESDEDTFRAIRSFIVRNVSYVADIDQYENEGYNHEIIKSPRVLMQSGYGDCKSMALMTGAILKKLGYEYYYKLIWQQILMPNYTHVYVVAYDSEGNEYNVDPTSNYFNEKYIYYKSKKFEPMTRLTVMRGPAGKSSEEMANVEFTNPIIDEKLDIRGGGLSLIALAAIAFLILK